MNIKTHALWCQYNLEVPTLSLPTWREGEIDVQLQTLSTFWRTAHLAQTYVSGIFSYLSETLKETCFYRQKTIEAITDALPSTLYHGDETNR